MNARTNDGSTPLIVAASYGAVYCLALLIARGGDTLGLNAIRTGNDGVGNSALHYAAFYNYPEIIALLLQAGANPTVKDVDDETPLDYARAKGHPQCAAILETAMLEPQCPRLLLKTRALLDAAHAIREARAGNISNDDDNEQDQPVVRRRSPRLESKEQTVAAAPVYLKQQAAQGQELPRVEINDGDDQQLVACIKYALGLEGGGGVVVFGVQEEPAVGMLPEVFVELCEMMVPKWDRANV